MAKNVLAQQDMVIQTSITTPATGFFGFGALSDGLYQRDFAGVALRLLSTGDVISFATAAQGNTADDALPAASFTNESVMDKLITGFSTVSGILYNTDTLVQAISKLNGNILLKANTASPTFTGTVSLPTGQLINGVVLSTTAGASVYLAGDGTYKAINLTGMTTSPVTTKGDLYTWDTAAQRLPVGVNGQVLASDSSKTTGLSWITIAGGGNVMAVATPLNNQIGVWTGSTTLEGDANLTWDSVNQIMAISGTSPKISIAAINAEPASPAAGNMIIYAKSIAGKMVLKTKGPLGLDVPLQSAFWQNSISMWSPTNLTGGFWLGTVGATTGTFLRMMPTTASTYLAINRSRYANVVTTLNQVLGVRNTELMYSRGSLANQGGFFFSIRIGFDVWTNGGRFFAGMHTGTTVISANPSLLNNTVGFCIESTDLGTISFLTRDGSLFTKASTGMTVVSGKGYDCFMFCGPNSTSISWRIVDINTGAEASGVATATLPVNTTMLTVGVLASNAALTPVTSIALGVNKIYTEIDY